MPNRPFTNYWSNDFSGSSPHRNTDVLKDERIQAQCFFDGTYAVTIPAVNTDVVISPTVQHNGVAVLGVDQGDNLEFTITRAGSVFLTATIITTGATGDRLAFWFRKNGEKLNASKGISRTSAPGTGDIRQCIIQTLQDVSEDDVIDIVCQNQSDDSNFSVTNLTSIIKS